MERRFGRGFAAAPVLGIAALLLLGAALLIATHESDSSISPTQQGDSQENISVGSGAAIEKPVAREEREGRTIGQETQTQTPQSYKPQGCVSNTNPQFTHPFTDLSTIDALNPIGGIGGGSPGRSYIGVKEGMEAPLYAPINATLRKIIYADRGSGYGEYGLIFAASCEVEFMFDHIDRLSDTLAKYAPKTAAATSQIQDNMELTVRINAGELLGYSNGTPLARTFDFLLTNYAKKASYINPKRWEWEQALYSQCPYDYFVSDLKSQYYGKLGKPGHLGFVKADACGNPSHDVAGTASGGWFKGDSTDKRGEYLAIARDYNDAQIAYRKDGQAFESSQAVQTGKPYLNIVDFTPGTYPEEITPGQSICYSNNNEWAFITLLSNTELSFAKGSGACPAEFPESQTETWVR